MACSISYTKVELECICGRPIKGLQDLEYVYQSSNSMLVKCSNKACHLEFIAVVEFDNRSITISFSPMFSDWNLLHMGKDRLESMLERAGHHLLLEIFGAERKKFFKVNLGRG